MSRELTKYDIHGHIVIPEFKDFLEDAGGITPKGNTIDGTPVPNWDLDVQWELMAQLGIKWALLTHSSPAPYCGDIDKCKNIVRLFNERAAEYKRDYPERLGYAAVLPLPDVEAACEEAIINLDSMGANGVKLGTNIAGQYLGDPALNPLFEELDKRSTLIILHPHLSEPLNTTTWTAKFGPGFEFVCDTTRAVINMIMNGVFERYKNIKVVVPHCSSFLSWQYDKFLVAGEFSYRNGIIDEPVDVKSAYDRLYFDTAGMNVEDQVRFMLKICAAPSHILYGSDTAYTPPPVNERTMSRLEAAFESDPELAPYKDMIFAENCKRLVGLD